MRLAVHEILLTDRDVWRSAREAIPEQPALLVELSPDGTGGAPEPTGVSGFGEASAFMTDRYNSGLDTMHRDLRTVAAALRALPPDDPELTWRTLAPRLAGSPFLLAALDVAAHDLAARLAGVPLWEHLAARPPGDGLRSSYSIGLDEPREMVRKLLEQPDWPAYKVKLAAAGDLHVLRALREHTGAPFYVDGNCGWDPEDTVAALEGMRELGVEVLEQPFPRECWAQARKLKDLSPIPVFADESITGPQDLPACATAFHGVNLKLMKAGGITPALRLLREARRAGLLTMLGCMPESSAGVSATAHLGSSVDHLDVDSIALLAVDTGTGVRLGPTGRITFPDAPGSGFVPDFRTPAFVVRSEPAAGTGVRLSVRRAGAPVAACEVRPGRLPGRSAGPAAWQLTGDPAGGGPAERSESAALLRTAVTHAVAHGAGAVWLRTGAAGVSACQDAGFVTASDAAADRSAGESPYTLMIWKAERQ